MSQKAAITVLCPPEEAQRLWESSEYKPEYAESTGAEVRFTKAPGDRGTEIHISLDKSPPAGRLGEAVQKLRGSEPHAKLMDDLRRFKQRVETGEIARSEGAPEGELAERKFKQRPAQPLEDSELEKAGA
jgi:uncharacterized membrane protein